MAIFHKKNRVILFTWLLSLVFILVLSSLQQSGIRYGQPGFSRLFYPRFLDFMGQRELGQHAYYIAGGTGTRLYLADVAEPTHVLEASYTLQDTQHLRLPLSGSAALLSGARKVVLDSLRTYVMSGRGEAFLQGTWADMQPVDFIKDNRSVHDAIPLGPASYIIRTYDTSLQQSVMLKTSKDEAGTNKTQAILEKQADGFYCTDGMLLYAAGAARLIYVYYYRNQFVCLDTVLNVCYKGTTIDTVRQGVTIAEIPLLHTSALAEPPVLVNKKSCIAGDKLFIHSAIAHRKNNGATRHSNSIIDVYTLTDGVYQYSFHLSDFDGKRVKDFRVFGNTLVALYDEHLLTYKISRWPD